MWWISFNGSLDELPAFTCTSTIDNAWSIYLGGIILPLVSGDDILMKTFDEIDNDCTSFLSSISRCIGLIGNISSFSHQM